MWKAITRWIIEWRIVFSLCIVAITLFLGYEGTKLQMSYEYGKIVPDNDPDMLLFKKFTSHFGEDGNAFIVGLEGDKLYNVRNFNLFSKFCSDLQQIPGVEEVIAMPTARQICKDTLNRKFLTLPVFDRTVENQQVLDSLLSVFHMAKFYQGLLYNPQSKATLIAVVIDQQLLSSDRRDPIIRATLDRSYVFAEQSGVKIHYAGLPYVRFINLGLFKDEFKLLVFLSALVTCLILYFLFRSFYALFFTIVVTAVTVVWCMGFTVLFGYKITILTGMLPALIVIISIPNCIYMLNQYHHEYKKHSDKLKAVSKVIEKIGFVTFMTNINTAVGFFVLLVTDITIIYEFGMIAGIMGVATFLICLTVIPALFMFLPPPGNKEMMHLDKKVIGQILNRVNSIIINYRPWVYATTCILLAIAAIGILRVKAISYIVDDFPENKLGIRADLQFFEKNFGGVMPLEIMVDFNKKRAVYDIKHLQQIEQLQNALQTISGLSPALSINTLVKASVQGFYNNDTAAYRLPTNNEKIFIAGYLKRSKTEMNTMQSLVDSNAGIARISLKIADVGTIDMDNIIENQIKPAIASVFDNTGIKVDVTGTSLLFLKGNQYLIHDLSQSLVMAFILISIMMAFLFTDVKIILISLIPNIIPMIITLGVMGLLDIRLKTSTAVIFSTSFGITIDSTIHFLSKFKQELAIKNISILEVVVKSLKEAGVSMLYTSGVLLIGFGIFMFSDFGQTVALGLLTCITLFFATLTNMVLLPVLLVDFVKKK